MVSASSVTANGRWRKVVKMSNRLGVANACNVVATWAADSASRRAAGRLRPSTPVPPIANLTLFNK